MSAVSETETSRGVWRVSSLASSSGRVNLLFFVLSLAIVITTASSERSLIQRHGRHKRNTTQLCNHILVTTGFPCVKFNDYGCYCGILSIPGPPVDDVDRCCMIHDDCYEKLDPWCRGLVHPHEATWDMRCDSERCYCTAKEPWTPCEFQTCLCDSTLGWCLKAARYDKRFKDYCPRLPIERK